MATIVRDTGLQTGSAVGTDSASFAALPAVGNHVLVASAIWETTAPSMTAVTDNQGHTPNEDIERAAPSADCGASIYSNKVVTSSGTYTVTVDPAGSVWMEWIAFEVAGLDATAHLDQTGSATSTTGTGAATADAVNTTASGLAVFCLAVANENDSDIQLVPDTYTLLARNNNASGTVGFLCATKTYTSTETSTESATHETTLQTGWAAAIATYKDAGGGGGGGGNIAAILGRAAGRRTAALMQFAR